MKSLLAATLALCALFSSSDVSAQGWGVKEKICLLLTSHDDTLIDLYFDGTLLFSGIAKIKMPGAFPGFEKCLEANMGTHSLRVFRKGGSDIEGRIDLFTALWVRIISKEGETSWIISYTPPLY